MSYINRERLCEDLMSRWETADKEKEKEIQSIMANIVIPIVAGQPSADVVEVKHGKWIENSTGTSYKCSVCGCSVLYAYNMDLSYREYSDYCECLSNFCPHCGANMKGETNG